MRVNKVEVCLVELVSVSVSAERNRRHTCEFDMSLLIQENAKKQYQLLES